MALEMDADFEYTFTDLRKTHNRGVFDVYSPDMLRCRKSGVLTSLPDGYGRGRSSVIGAARVWHRYLVREREHTVLADLRSNLERGQNLEATIRLREELANAVARCCKCKRLAAKYGYIISRPARNARKYSGFYFAYLAAVKSQKNGGAMSLGKNRLVRPISTLTRFPARAFIDRRQAQELIDHFIMKDPHGALPAAPEFDSLLFST